MLRKGGATASYHRMTELSVGLLAGAQSQAIFILFMTEDALRRFEASRGWTVGADADIAMVRCTDPEQPEAGPRAQPVFCLMRTALLESLVAFLHAGGRKIDRWTAQHRVALVDFAEAAAFFNANTLAELRALEARHG